MKLILSALCPVACGDPGIDTAAEYTAFGTRSHRLIAILPRHLS